MLGARAPISCPDSPFLWVRRDIAERLHRDPGTELSDSAKFSADGPGARSIGETVLVSSSGALTHAAAWRALDRDYAADPVRGVERDVTASGVRVRVAEQGSGPHVMLLHGLFADGSTWDRVAGALARDYHVVVPDLPGFGASEKPAPQRFPTASTRSSSRWRILRGPRARPRLCGRARARRRDRPLARRAPPRARGATRARRCVVRTDATRPVGAARSVAARRWLRLEAALGPHGVSLFLSRPRAVTARQAAARTRRRVLRVVQHTGGAR